MKGVPDDRDPSGRFVRGLTLGALVGAVVAGSSLWSRTRSRKPRDRPVTPVDRPARVPDGAAPATVTGPEAPRAER